MTLEPEICSIRFVIMAGEGGVELLEARAEPGETARFFWAAAPEASFDLHLAAEGGAPDTRTILRAEWTSVPDVYEPNYYFEDAATIAAGESIEAWSFAGYDQEGSISDKDLHDYFLVGLKEGALQVLTEDEPDEFSLEIALFERSGEELPLTLVDEHPGGRTVAGSVPAGASYVLRVQPVWYRQEEPVGVGSDLPSWFTRPYTVQIRDGVEE